MILIGHIVRRIIRDAIIFVFTERRFSFFDIGAIVTIGVAVYTGEIGWLWFSIWILVAVLASVVMKSVSESLFD